MKLCPTCGRDFPDNTKFCPVDGTTLRAKAASADLIGQVVADRYHIIKKLGEGGMGAVYLGEHVKMGRKSAIKVMAAAMAQDPDAISRFNREASNASRISHPNVCQIYDFGETPEGLIYLAMEFIEGEALTELIEREGALDAPRAASLLKQSADALQAAHDLGIVHRDIKPDNIMVLRGRDGGDVVKVVDFGIARAVGGDESGQKVTKTGLVVGTPEYMSPEQLSGDKLDGRSDIYSLGLVLYRMLTGVLPFQADSAQETMIKRLTDDPTPLMESRPDIVFPDGMQQVMDRALARNRENRYQNGAEFGADAMGAVAGMAMPQTRVAPAAGGAATQVLDEDAVRELTTKQKAAASKGGARPRASGTPPAPMVKKSQAPLFIGGSLGFVAVAATIAVLAMKGSGAAEADGNQPDTSTRVALNPSNPDTAKGQTTPSTNPGGQRPGNPSNPGTQNPGTRETTTTRPPVNPVPAVDWADSLQVANDAFDADQIDRARALGAAVYAASGVPGSMKARAAVLVATTWAGADSERQLQWYRNALRYEPNNARVRQGIIDLGGTP